MTRIAFLTDLHFGFHRPRLVAPLLAELTAAAPDLVVVAGDLTQRATRSQFAQARSFLDALPAPWLALPGNHDIPLVNLAARLMWPFARYRRRIVAQTAPLIDLPGLRLIGVNTTDPLAHARGTLPAAEIDRIAFDIAARPEAMAVLVLHHPLYHPPGITKTPIPEAEAALTRLAAAGAQVILSGHLHEAWAGTVPGAEAVLQVQGASALCARPEDRQSEFALLEMAPGAVALTRFIAPMDRNRFARGPRRAWHQTPEGWQRGALPGEKSDRPETDNPAPPG